MLARLSVKGISGFIWMSLNLSGTQLHGLEVGSGD